MKKYKLIERGGGGVEYNQEEIDGRLLWYVKKKYVLYCSLVSNDIEMIEMLCFFDK